MRQCPKRCRKCSEHSKQNIGWVDSTVAGLVALLMLFLMMVRLLAPVADPHQSQSEKRDVTLYLAFIPREVARPVAAYDLQKRKTPTHRTAPRTPVSRRLSGVQIRERVQHIAVGTQQSETLDLTVRLLQSDALLSAPSVMERREDGRLDAPKNLNGVKLRDSSLGGRIQRMSRIYDCGELMAALAKHPESTDTIMATMKRRGCGDL